MSWERGQQRISPHCVARAEGGEGRERRGWEKTHRRGREGEKGGWDQTEKAGGKGDEEHSHLKMVGGVDEEGPQPRQGGRRTHCPWP